MPDIYREKGEKMRQFRYAAIDYATRVRTLKVYEEHTQANAYDFLDHVIKKFPFRIQEIPTDSLHMFPATLH